ncbi:lysoplasmalogenase [Bacillus badius]|uniref:lysoplasmalogenase n=1 Tax=Bacillus badius TaxID=1455 RepID=UPI000597A469|nr:lysoplasmalogenase [Bacillus badius]KIL73885.1 putative membrane protein [Bacillus badius]
MRTFLLPLLIGITSVIYIFIIPADPLAFKIICKLIPMMLIILYAFRRLPVKPSTAHRLLVMGLFFCIMGDGLIAVSFVAGLGAFLIGHLFYLSSFLKVTRASKRHLLAIVPIAIYAFVIGRQLIASLLIQGNDQLVLPVIFYMLAISLMALSAVLTGNFQAIAGSTLFIISDSILSWNMFVSAIPFSDLFIMSTYYAAQFLIAGSLSSLGSHAGHASAGLEA